MLAIPSSAQFNMIISNTNKIMIGINFELLKISDYACTGAALFVIVFSLMGDYYEYQNKKSMDRAMFNFGFITLCTSLGTIFGAALGVHLTGTPTAFGIGCLIGSYLGLRLKHKIGVE